MGCTQFRTPLTPLHFHLKHKQHPRTAKLLWLPCNDPTELLLHKPNNLSLLAPRTNSIPNTLFLGESIQAKPGGDISGLLLIGAALFFMYFIANFVVPNLIMKGYQLDKASEDQKHNEDDSI